MRNDIITTVIVAIASSAQGYVVKKKNHNMICTFGVTFRYCVIQRQNGYCTRHGYKPHVPDQYCNILRKPYDGWLLCVSDK